MSQPVPTLNINGIDCAHFLPEGRLALSESATEDGPGTTIQFKVAWDDRWKLVQALRGTCGLDGDGNLTRNAPYALPSNSNLVCTSVGEFGYIGSGAYQDGSVYAPFAVLPARFSCVPWQFVDGDPSGQNDASGQAWTVTRIKPSVEVYQPSGGSYYLGPFPSNTPLDEASIGFLRANCEVQQTRKFLPRMPLSKINAALGKISSNNVILADSSLLAGTLLLVAVETEPYFDCVGNPVMDVNYTYLGRSNGASWNSAQDRSGSYQRVNSKADGSGSDPFQTYDFSSLPR